MKFPTIFLASSLALTGSTVAASTKSSTKIPTSSKASSASTKTSSASCISTTDNINFDERVVNPVLPAANPVGIEDNIFFDSWAVIVQSDLDGVPPHSQPNFIVTGLEQQATNGTPSLTTLYPGSKVKSFTFYSFFFGCTANTVSSVAGAPLQCTITAAGFRNGQEVAVASYTFSPATGLVDVPMIQAVLPTTFVNLQNVTIIQDDPTLEALVADNFNVTTCS